MKTITIGISSVWQNRDRLDRFFEENRDAIRNFDEVIVILQHAPSSETSFVVPPLHNIRLVRTNTSGLSASRNIAVQQCKSDFLWFLDDDVTISIEAYATIIKAIQEAANADILTFRFNYSDADGSPKKYPSRRRLNRTDLLRVSSIEIVARTSFLRQSGVQFNVEFGLGSGRFPAGEENLFLIESYDNGAQIVHIPNVIVLHPQGNREIAVLWRKRGRLTGMGRLARKFGIVGIILILRWGYRGLSKGIPPRELIQLLSGFFRSERRL